MPQATMPLPSIYSSDGLSEADQRRVITFRSNPRRESASDGFVDEDMVDVEMTPMDDMEESQMISDIVTSSRIDNQFAMSDEMELDRYTLQTATVSLQGNISYLIIDTNFILSQLGILNDLKNIGERFGLVIVIPIQVVRELDGLKSASNRVSHESWGSSQDISKLARNANDWIFSCLAQRCPTVKGQGLKERIDKFTTKDDAILDCCLYYKSEHIRTLQVLFSNDKNLCSKALMNEVLTISYHKGMSAQLIAEKIYEENVMRFGFIDSSTVANVEVEVEVPSATSSRNPEQVCDEIYSEISAVTAHVITQCMALEYGEDIDLIRDYDKKSIKTLEDAVMVIIRFWIPVFSQDLRGHEPFEEVGSRKVPTMLDIPQSGHELRSFVEFWGRTLLRLHQKNERLQEGDTIKQYVARWNDLGNSL